MYLIIDNNRVINASVGIKPDGYKPESHVFVERTGEYAEAWIGWIKKDGNWVDPNAVVDLTVDEMQQQIDNLQAQIDEIVGGQNADPVAEPPEALEARI